jgi:hypothetical protein
LGAYSKGFIDKAYKNSLNNSLVEWQQAKQKKRDPKVIEQLIT